MNSSKVKVIVFESNPFVESGGVTFKSKGGSESLGPPVGGMILAQPEFSSAIFEIKRTMRK